MRKNEEQRTDDRRRTPQYTIQKVKGCVAANCKPQTQTTQDLNVIVIRQDYNYKIISVILSLYLIVNSVTNNT
jgi:hypothetical protein